MVSATFDTVFGVMLLFIAMSLAFGSIIGSVAVNMSVMPQGGAMLGNTVGRSLLLHMQGIGGYIPGDALLQMDEKSPSITPCVYTDLHNNQFNFDKSTSFRVDMYAPLNVSVSVSSDGIAATVTKALRHEPAQAFVHLYIFNGTDVTDSLTGETSLDGKVFFYVTTFTTTEVGVLFAHAGASTGYSVFNDNGLATSRGELYVQAGKLSGIGGASNVNLFAFEDWWGPLSIGTNVNVNSYSLPALLLYKVNATYMYSPHPWVPGSCGPGPSTVAGVYVSDQTFNFRVEAGAILIMRLRTWGTGGE